MMTRSTTTSVVVRASAMRRQRRRSASAQASSAPYCGTNGCASLLTIDAASGVAHCQICGFRRRLH